MMGRRGFLGGVAAMAGRPYGDYVPRGRVAGGLPPMRPDQQIQVPGSQAGSGPAPQNAFIIAQRVIVFGTGPARGIFVYSPVPGAGNLVASTAAAKGTDPYGNAFLAGTTGYTQVSGTFYAAAIGPTGIPGAAALLAFWTAPGSGGPWTLRADVAADTAGNLTLAPTGSGVIVVSSGVLQATLKSLQAIDGIDSNTYDTERRTLYTTGAQIINSTSDAVITGLSIPVAAARYQIDGTIRFTENVTDAANNPVLAFHGPALADMETEFSELLVGGAGGVVTIVQSGAFGNITLTAFASHTQVVKISGILNFSASGTLSLQAHTTLAADTFTIAQNSRLAVMPVST